MVPFTPRIGIVHNKWGNFVNLCNLGNWVNLGTWEIGISWGGNWEIVKSEQHDSAWDTNIVIQTASWLPKRAEKLMSCDDCELGLAGRRTYTLMNTDVKIANDSVSSSLTKMEGMPHMTKSGSM